MTGEEPGNDRRRFLVRIGIILFAGLVVGICWHVSLTKGPIFLAARQYVLADVGLTQQVGDPVEVSLGWNFKHTWMPGDEEADMEIEVSGPVTTKTLKVHLDKVDNIWVVRNAESAT
jgi:hypothetical protein